MQTHNIKNSRISYKLGLFATAFLLALPGLASAQVVISQIFPGGGGAATYYQKDYVELLNLGTTAQSLDGWSLQYGSATGLFGSSATNMIVLPAVSIPAKCYFLVESSTIAGGATGNVIVTSDTVNNVPNYSTTNMSMSGTNGKVGLFNVNTQINAAITSTDSRVVDLVGWGTATVYEGAAVPTITASNVLVRKNLGQQDTNNNLNDFEVLTFGANNTPPTIYPRNLTSVPVPVTLSHISIE